MMLQVLLFYNDRASFTTLVQLMEKQSRYETLQEHVDRENMEEEDLKALFYHIELVQLLGNSRLLLLNKVALMIS